MSNTAMRIVETSETATDGRTRYTDAQRAQVKDLALQGMSTAGIAAATGVNYQTVRLYIKALEKTGECSAKRVKAPLSTVEQIKALKASIVSHEAAINQARAELANLEALRITELKAELAAMTHSE